MSITFCCLGQQKVQRQPILCLINWTDNIKMSLNIKPVKAGHNITDIFIYNIYPVYAGII